MKKLRHLLVIFGDQLDHQSAVFDGFDSTQDDIWMAEVDDESKHVWSHKQRIAIFLSAMRHFRDELRAKDYEVIYTELNPRKQPDKFSSRLSADLKAYSPDKVIVVRPGEWRVLQGLKKVCREEDVELELREDTHFYTTLYWDYLIRHQDKLRNNNRMSLQVRNLDRLNSGERASIAKAANVIRKKPAVRYSNKK